MYRNSGGEAIPPLQENGRASRRTTGRVRRISRYLYLRFTRLRGDPHELALGMAIGIFTGALPILPFQIALAVVLAFVFKASKIAAALGTWVSNPLNWYFLYLYSYKIGAAVLDLPHTNAIFSSIMTSVQNQEGAMAVAEKIVGAGGLMMAAFLIGGLVMGLVVAPPSYFIFLKVFRALERWRRKRGSRLHG